MDRTRNARTGPAKAARRQTQIQIACVYNKSDYCDRYKCSLNSHILGRYLTWRSSDDSRQPLALRQTWTHLCDRLAREGERHSTLRRPYLSRPEISRCLSARPFESARVGLTVEPARGNRPRPPRLPRAHPNVHPLRPSSSARYVSSSS